jgi:hypothetical protein
MASVKNVFSPSSRRKFIQQSGALVAGTLLSENLLAKALAGPPHQFLQMNAADKIGGWNYTENGLPFYEYRGKLPFAAVDKEGKDALLPGDPFFILGNYRCTV